MFEKPQREQIVRIKIEAFSLDLISGKAHLDGTGALKKHSRPHRLRYGNAQNIPDQWTTSHSVSRRVIHPRINKRTSMHGTHEYSS